MIANHDECTFELLRYTLGGNRPSQTDLLTLFQTPIEGYLVRDLNIQEWYFTDDSIIPDDITSKSPTYPTHEY